MRAQDYRLMSGCGHFRMAGLQRFELGIKFVGGTIWVEVSERALRAVGKNRTMKSGGTEMKTEYNNCISQALWEMKSART
jgi:hypothetical protein